MSERATEGSEFAEWQSATTGHPLGEKATAGAGPYDAHDVDTPEYADAVDLGPLLVRLPPEAQLLVQSSAGAAARTAHLTVPSGKVDLSVLAAPRSSALWPQIAEEVAAVQGGRGARVDTEPGQWGQELRAVSEDELSWFIGVDGPRWMLYGVATGPVEADAELAATLRELLRGTVVRRGREPMPVKTALVLTPPDERAADESREPVARSTVNEPVWFRMGPTPTTRLTAVPDAPAPVTQAPVTPAADAPTTAEPRPAAPLLSAPLPAAAAPMPEPVAPANPDRPWPLPVEVHDWRPTVLPVGAPPRRRIGPWALPTGPSVGVAGLVLLVGVGTVLVAVRGTRAPAAAPAALPDPATSVTNPGSDPATALTNPGPQPTNTLPGLPGLVPDAPPAAAPVESRPASTLAGRSRASARAVEQSHRGSRRTEQALDSDRSATDGDTGSSQPSGRADGDERAAYPGLLGGLVSALNPAQLGIG